MSANNRDIAVIGIAGRFPESQNIHEMWKNLMEGKQCIAREETIITSEAGYDYVNAFGRLEDIEMFDRQFFGINAGEAKSIDPQERLLMQCSHEALEDAGCNYITYPGIIGIVCGSYTNESFFEERFATGGEKRHWDSTIC